MINDAHIAELLIREEGSAIQIRNFAQRKIVQRLKQEIMARRGRTETPRAKRPLGHW